MNKRFRNGIFLLSIVAFLIIIISFVFQEKKELTSDLVEIKSYQSQIDSLKLAMLESKKEYVIRPFNPNFITDYKGYTLGLSSEELDRLYQFRLKDKWINSSSDFQRVTKVSDSLLAKISPLFKFPEWVNKPRTSIAYSSKKKFPQKTFAQKKDLNQVLVKELVDEINIPDFIAERIINYRKKIGGFIDDKQLLDVSGLYESQRTHLLSDYTVKTFKSLEKINLNQATVKELMEVPYFDFEMALEIRDFIKDRNGVSSFEELGKINGFDVEKIDRIELYLKLE